MSRRTFLQQSSVLGAAALLGISRHAHAEPPPEVRKIRLAHFPAICLAPGYLAEELLRAEGFDEIEYVDIDVNTTTAAVGSGRVDIWMDAAPSLVNLLATADSAVALGGLHSGCYELVAKTDVKSIRALRGRSVAVSTLGSTEHIFVAGIVSYVGLDPQKDIEWKVAGSSDKAVNLFAAGGADAILGFAPQPQELRARKIGHVILNTTHDRPWSQYFCCMITANREFLRRSPVATKRAIRAFLKGAELCATDPARAARFMANKGYAPSYETALEVISDLPYRRWRDASPEDTIRFHALRLHEAGIIKTNPEKLIEKGTDWRFFNELKKELKA